MTDATASQVLDQTNILQQYLQNHGIETVEHERGLFLPRHDMYACAAIVREIEHPGVFIAQLDVLIDLWPGRRLVESIAGFGATRKEAATEAWNAFSQNSLHVILGTLFNCGNEQITEESWVIGGTPRQLTLGNIFTRGRLPEGSSHKSWINQIEEKIKAQPLDGGLHWVRVYYAQQAGQMNSCEVLLDNETWQPLQVQAEQINWPVGEHFYSVRLFMMIRGGFDIHRAIGIFYTMNQEDDECIFVEMEKLSSNTLEAEKAFTLIPLAFGRALLQRMGAQLAPIANIWNYERKEPVEIQLKEEAIFTQALRLAEEAFTDNGAINREMFQAIASRSSEMNTVNQALEKDSDITNWDFSPPQLIWPSMVEVTLAKLEPRSWWKFWQT